MRNVAALFFLLTALSSFATDRADIDLYNESYSFSGSCTKQRPCPHLELFQDSSNNTVGNACIRGASRAELEALGVPDLGTRLQKLVDGDVLVVKNGKYRLTIPVLVGTKRDEVAVLVNRVAKRISPEIRVMLAQIQASQPHHQDIVFHLLWSRVMDEVWCQTWHKEQRSGSCPPAVKWVVFPQHPFSVGTNYSADDVGVTWSRKTLCNAGLVLNARLTLMKAAWGQKVVSDRVSGLEQLGLVDKNGHFQAFSYRADDSLDKLLQKQRDMYAALLKNAYDYDGLSASLEIPADDLFVILLHETAYAVFENLSHSGKLDIPPVLKGQGPVSGCRSVVSFLLKHPVKPEDEIQDLFSKSGWRGDQSTIDACNEALRKDPSNVVVLEYLGLSLYQLGDYHAALKAFRKMNALTTDEPNSLHLVSHLWMGNIYDLIGERGEAVKQYREILKSHSKNMFINYTGYGIGPTTAREWAEARIRTPYTRN